MTAPLEADLVVDVAELVIAQVEPLLDLDWDTGVAGLDWTARQVLDHLASLSFNYGVWIARRATSWPPRSRPPDDARTPAELLVLIDGGMRLLRLALADMSDDDRVFHPAGMADRAGYVAMTCDELIVHGADIAGALGGDYEVPDEITRAVLERLFPWAPADVDPWTSLWWANGRAALPGHEDLGSTWVWHSAPLDEWDGSIPRWSS